MKAAGPAIGIDIGGTKLAVALVHPSGRILAQRTLATEAERGFERAVGRIETAIRAVLRPTRAGRGQLAGIGVGCAGPVDPARGLINNPYTLAGWNQCDLVTPLQRRFGVPVWLENDADAAALGECFQGAGRGFDPVVMLTFGTGVGGAALVRGQVYRGVQGEHPELGHLPVSPDGPDCYCGTRGCLESMASGTAVGEAGRSLGFPDARAVFAAARAGHPAAEPIVNRALAAAATAAWTICHTLLPARLVLGGGMMAEHYDLFAEAIRHRLAGATQFPRAAVSIAPAALGNDAGLVGAASLAWRPLITL
ncbi:MAG: ROK family protein [Verrucomicrobia bacterium]|nr:ROK family protein [Verrucomicrobiota bacterium]